MNNIYTVKEVIEIGNLLDDETNFKCIKCNKKGEMTYQALPFKYNKYGFDYCCGWCGQWQLEEEA